MKISLTQLATSSCLKRSGPLTTSVSRCNARGGGPNGAGNEKRPWRGSRGLAGGVGDTGPFLKLVAEGDHGHEILQDAAEFRARRRSDHLRGKGGDEIAEFGPQVEPVGQ